MHTPARAKKTVWMPLPDTDFDPTESAVPWKLLTEAGHRVVFVTERGGPGGACDPLMVTGALFGQLGAEPEPLAFYQEMVASPAWQATESWTSFDPLSADALVLAGGHAPGMKQYLGAAPLHARVATFFATGRPTAAICHGVIVLARAQQDGKSVLHDYQTTCLPRYMERTAYLISAWKLGRYYRTYDAYVEAEVRAALDDPKQFVRGPRTLMKRGTRDNDRPAFTVRDRHYLSARWPGDAYLFGKQLVEML